MPNHTGLSQPFYESCRFARWDLDGTLYKISRVDKLIFFIYKLLFLIKKIFVFFSLFKINIYNGGIKKYDYILLLYHKIIIKNYFLA